MDDPLNILEHPDNYNQLQEDLNVDAEGGEDDAEGGEDHEGRGAGDEPGEVGLVRGLQSQPDVGADNPDRESVE